MPNKNQNSLFTAWYEEMKTEKKKKSSSSRREERHDQLVQMHHHLQQQKEERHFESHEAQEWQHKASQFRQQQTSQVQERRIVYGNAVQVIQNGII